MPNEKTVSEFDALFAEILADAPDLAVQTVADPGDEPSVVEPPVLKMETIGDTVKHVPAQQVAATETPKPEYKRDEGKQSVDGAPFQSTVYTRGYIKVQWTEGWRFENKCCLYLEELEGLEQFMASPAYQEWKSAAISKGLRRRKEA